MMKMLGFLMYLQAFLELKTSKEAWFVELIQDLKKKKKWKRHRDQENKEISRKKSKWRFTQLSQKEDQEDQTPPRSNILKSIVLKIHLSWVPWHLTKEVNKTASMFLSINKREKRRASNNINRNKWVAKVIENMTDNWKNLKNKFSEIWSNQNKICQCILARKKFKSIILIST